MTPAGAFTIELWVQPDDEPLVVRESFELVLVPRPTALRMPVVRWGGASGRGDELREIGFTHTIGVGCDFRAVWDAEGPGGPGDEARVSAGLASGLEHNTYVQVER